MKRIIIAILIIVLCGSGAAAELSYVSENVDRFTQDVQNIDALLSRGKNRQALALCISTNKRWDETAPSIDALLIHDYVDNIGIHLRQMQSYLENGTWDMYHASNVAVKKGLASIKGSEYPLLENIL